MIQNELSEASSIFSLCSLALAGHFLSDGRGADVLLFHQAGPGHGLRASGFRIIHWNDAQHSGPIALRHILCQGHTLASGGTWEREANTKVQPAFMGDERILLYLWPVGLEQPDFYDAAGATLSQCG